MKKNKGFTLVEVLICVGIIGIIAAITIPAIIGSTSEKALEAQRKALHSRMSQAFAQIKNLQLYETSTANADGATYTDDYSALNLIVNAFGKVYKLSSTCNYNTITDCSIPADVIDYYDDTNSESFPLLSKETWSAYNENISQSQLGGLDARYAGFKTANGESILMYYNPKCKSKSEASPHDLLRSVCVNMIYDLNGRSKAPNAYGEDIGVITVFYPTDSTVVMPVLYNKEIFSAGTYQDMLAKAAELDLVPPTIEELTSILINKNLTHITKNIDTSKQFWSSSYSSDGTTNAWSAGFDSGIQTQTASGTSAASLQYFLLKK